MTGVCGTTTAMSDCTAAAAAYVPYYSNAAFNKCMPLSVFYTATVHLVSLFLKPFVKIPVQTLFKEDCFQPPLITITTNNDDDVMDKKKKNRRHVAIVTGSNTGIGFETANSLVEMGYDVILACRSRQKGEEAATQINNSSSSKRGKAYFLHPLDLSSFTSIRQFVSIFSETHDTLHILINNAGINTTGISNNDDNNNQSFDLCFQTNYLGHYLLTRLLTPYLFQAKNIHYQQDNNNDDGKMVVEAGRVVNLSSVTHHFVRPDEKRYNGMEEKGENHSLQEEEETMNHDWWKGCATPGVSTNTYKESKLAAILFTQELNKRYSKHGLRAVTVNPGAVNSDIWRGYPKWLLKYILGPLFRLLYLTPKEGSQTSLVGAVGILPSCNKNDEDDCLYIQPYWLPTKKKMMINSKSFPFIYNVPFPVFEMLGLYIGHAITQPRLPTNSNYHSKTLWEVSEQLVGL